MELLRFLRSWKMSLPSRWGLGHSDIHISLLFTLGLVFAGLAGLAASNPSYYELHTAAITLPIVWTLSLAVRIAAQQLSVGPYSHEMMTHVGPSGNLSTDYEFLPAGRVLSYSLAGQLATCGLLMVGVLVNAAMLPVVDGRLELPRLLDFVCGWGSRAWATQIMWVNAFIGLVNLLPTVPFDMRATFFAVYSRRQRHVQEPSVFRKLASLDSHLSAVMAGVAGTAVVVGFAVGTEVVGWYAAAAAAVYLFVAGRWEGSRALDLEEQYAPIAPRALRAAPAPAISNTGGEPEVNQGLANLSAADAEEISNSLFLSSGDQHDGDAAFEEQAVDIDEILRKLHREGADALSLSEQQALLSASRELQQKRSKR